MKKKFLFFVLYFLSLSVLSSQKDIIRFATEATYPPFESIDSNNRIIGFDIDIANMICKKIDVICTFTNQSFDSLIPSLKMRRFDALISAIDITSERKKQVDFSIPYYNNFATFFILNAYEIDKTSLFLKIKKIGVQNGTTHQKYIMQKYKHMHIIPYEHYQTAILDLQNKRINAFFGDFDVISEWLKKSNDQSLFMIGEKIQDPNYFSGGFGIAVRKGNKVLLEKLNASITQAKKDGSYDIIYEKWLKK
ncbi:MAG: transporter substrate-binding domain-containing protein [Arsenophonus sp.]|nr:MAG: transporter substrate-binding domain-containing protein [Arsenophonus sp.]